MRRVTLIYIAVFVLGATASPSAARAANLPAGFFGVNAETLFGAPESLWPVQLNAMERGAIKFVRSDAEWDVAEPRAPGLQNRHSYDWSQFDAIVTALAQHHLSWYPIIDYSARWAASWPGDIYSPPTFDSDYATYAAALVKRYGAHGRFWQAHPQLRYLPVEQWEIWNEENGKFSPGRYIGLYLSARSAIRSADPSAKVVVGGLGDGADTNRYIAGMYQSRPDAKGRIDAIGFHPYPLDPGQTAAPSMQLITSLRTYLNSIGDQNVPLEITEVGWYDQGIGAISDSARAQQLTQLIDDLASSNQGVTEFMPYAWVTGGASGHDYFGMFNWDGSPTAEGAAYLNAIKAFSATSDGALKLARPRLGRDGLIRETISCPHARHKCRGVLTARTLPRPNSRFRLLRRAHSLPGEHFSLKGGTKVTLTFRLSPRLLALARRGVVQVGIRAHDAAAPSRTSPVLRIVSVLFALCPRC